MNRKAAELSGGGHIWGWDRESVYLLKVYRLINIKINIFILFLRIDETEMGLGRSRGTESRGTSYKDSQVN